MTSQMIALLAPQAQPAAALSFADYTEAAALIGCEARAIRAVSNVETGARGPFDLDGRPTILFERHLFHRATGGKFDKTAPDISNSVAGGYGKYSEQYARLARAASLDSQAALGSASWGAFQILGQYHAAAGFADVQQMVQAMKTGVRAHLLAFARFILANPAMHRAIVAKDWVALARTYNGASEAEHSYDVRLREAYLEDF
jgi:hypothetical protein